MKIPSGIISESWLCVDCGINTAPGCMNRVETEQAFNATALTGDAGVPMTFDDWSEV